jgi:D-glycerate 3-kinase
MSTTFTHSPIHPLTHFLIDAMELPASEILQFSIAQTRESNPRPILIGIQAPQGAGKTTLTRFLVERLPDAGLRGVSVSIDDFYLTRAEQIALAAENPGNPYLEHRGYPGTHDIDLGVATLTALKRLGPFSQSPTENPSLNASEISRMRRVRTARVPVYDKARHAGRGDRAPESEWRDVHAPVDIVFLEGWMLGFTPVPRARLDDPLLLAPNQALANYERWHRMLDAFVTLRAADPNFVLKWRVEAEEKMRASGRGGLTRTEIEDYVRRFLPAYEVYGGPPANIAPERRLTFTLDEQRRAISQT